MTFARVLCALLCAGLAGAIEAGAPRAGDFGAEALKVGGLTREYRLVVPKSVDLARPAPLVVAFHGMLIDSKDVMPVYTGLSRTAEKHRFLLTYPNAVGGSWGIAPEKVTSDLALFDALVDEVKADYKVDPDRLYVVGMSNGGYFAHLVGKERSRSVAAVASHSGPLGLQTLLGINAARKFPVLIIHGDKDNILPVESARDNRDRYKKEGHEVKYVEVPGLNHFWAPDSSETIWKFFADHPRTK